MTVFPIFSTSLNTYSRLDKKVQTALSSSYLMDAPNLSKIVLEYSHPIIKRYLYSIDISIDFKEEFKRRDTFDDCYPIDFFLFILAKDEIEAAKEVISLIKRFKFYKKLDFSVKIILNFKQRYLDEDNDPNLEPIGSADAKHLEPIGSADAKHLGVIKRKDKPFYTTKPVILYHAENQLFYEEVYKYNSKNKIRRRYHNKEYSRIQDFPVQWF
jgi:hypothetical protein